MTLHSCMHSLYSVAVIVACHIEWVLDSKHLMKAETTSKNVRLVADCRYVVMALSLHSRLSDDATWHETCRSQCIK